MPYHLGCKQPHPHSRRAQLANYRLHALPAAPLECDWTAGKADWGVLGNDQEGNCTLCGPLHQIMAWTASHGAQTTFTPAQAQAEYIAVTAAEGWPYDPRTHSNDNGCILADVCQRWQSTGLAGHTIAGWVQGEPRNLDELWWGTAVTGGALLALELPLTARHQLEAGQPWSLRSRYSNQGWPGTWGRHCVYLAGYTPEDVLLVTWGKVQIATLAWLQTYLDEVLFPISKDFLDVHGKAGNGLDWQQLLADLALLGPVL